MMLFQKKWTQIVFGGALLLALTVGGTAVLAQTDDGTETPATGEESVTEDPGQRGPRGNKIGHDDSFLAEELGITVEELQAAKEAVRAAVEEAGNGRDRELHAQLLAEELGITVETLAAAKEAAREAAIEQAIADGLITEEEAELMAAGRALREFIDRDELLAEVLGVTVEEIQAAKEAEAIDELVEAAGLDRESVQEAMQAAKDAAVQEAVAAGIITAEQAEQLENGEGFGGKHHGGRGHGPRGNGGPAPEAPAAADDSNA